MNAPFHGRSERKIAQLKAVRRCPFEKARVSNEGTHTLRPAWDKYAYTTTQSEPIPHESLESLEGQARASNLSHTRWDVVPVSQIGRFKAKARLVVGGYNQEKRFNDPNKSFLPLPTTPIPLRLTSWCLLRAYACVLPADRTRTFRFVLEQLQRTPGAHRGVEGREQYVYAREDTTTHGGWGRVVNTRLEFCHILDEHDFVHSFKARVTTSVEHRMRASQLTTDASVT